MNFANHSELSGLHAFLGASKYHWVNYDSAKIADSYRKFRAIQKGVVLHEFACSCIKLKQRLPKSKKSLNQYVNDAIGFRMTPEQILFYSENSFGTADAICFRDNKLMIFDLKTGLTPVSVRQLEIYTAQFCLEYEYSPFEIKIELRIYQLDEVLIHVPNPEDIKIIMDKIVQFNKELNVLKLEEE